ncbi:recombinase family protein [Candidatus Parcubacteria bacterium]|nr:recombinase family protein [Candidatus Parcubacteria bacterium]
MYVRVSSKEQKQEGYSIPAQKKLLTDYAKVNNFNVVKKFEDDETAKSAGRTGFGQMIEYLNSHKDVNTILVEKTDRLYRNFKDYVTIDELDVTFILVNENDLKKQIQTGLNSLKIPQETQDCIAEGLKQSFYIKCNTEDVIKQNLEDKKTKLEERMKILYEDRLDKIITPEFYQEKFTEYTAGIKNLCKKIDRYITANINYYILGTKILELSNNAGFLYENAFPIEKQELMNFLLSNSKLKDKKMLISYKKPFDKIYQRVSCSDMLGYRDSFRTFLCKVSNSY